MQVVCPRGTVLASVRGDAHEPVCALVEGWWPHRGDPLVILVAQAAASASASASTAAIDDCAVRCCFGSKQSASTFSLYQPRLKEYVDVGGAPTVAELRALIARYWDPADAVAVLVADDIAACDFNGHTWSAADRAWVKGRYASVAEMEEDDHPGWGAAVDAARARVADGSVAAAAPTEHVDLRLDGVPLQDLGYARALAAALFCGR